MSPTILASTPPKARSKSRVGNLIPVNFPRGHAGNQTGCQANSRSSEGWSLCSLSSLPYICLGIHAPRLVFLYHLEEANIFRARIGLGRPEHTRNGVSSHRIIQPRPRPQPASAAPRGRLCLTRPICPIRGVLRRRRSRHS